MKGKRREGEKEDMERIKECEGVKDRGREKQGDGRKDKSNQKDEREGEKNDGKRKQRK